MSISAKKLSGLQVAAASTASSLLSQSTTTLSSWTSFRATIIKFDAWFSKKHQNGIDDSANSKKNG